MCRTENGRALMIDDESVKDLLSSFKDKENTPEGRHATARNFGCRTENGRALMTDDESVKDLLCSFKDKGEYASRSANSLCNSSDL